MVKIEDAHKIRLKMRGKRAELSLVEYEPSLDEWNHVRTAAFARLRQEGSIPNELLDLVEHFQERTLVQSFLYKTTDGAGFLIGVKVTRKKTKKTRRDIIAKFAELLAAGKRIQADNKKGMTASEHLAVLLRVCLR